MVSSSKHSTAKKSLEKSGEIYSIINILISKLKVKKEDISACFSDSEQLSEQTIFPNKYATLIDTTLSAVSDALAEDLKKHHRNAVFPCVVALGGYGRRELGPFSDVDILFLSEDELTPAGKKLVEELNTIFWNAGIKLAYSVRTLAECEAAMTSDLHFLTGMLERRLIWGPKPVFRQLEKAFESVRDASPPGSFIAAKLTERDARHRKHGDSRFKLQPNVKESKGGLRDIQTLMWLANFLYGITTPEGLVEKGILTAAEAASLQEAQRFFWTVRCHLHLLTGRMNDRLSFEVQPEVAARMGYREPQPNLRAEKFMKDYFLMAKETGHLTRIICADLEARSLSGGATTGTRKIALDDVIEDFPVTHNRLNVPDRSYFRKTPSEIIRIFRAAQTSGHDIHPDALRAIRNSLKTLAPDLQADPTAHWIFLTILLDGRRAESTLRRMNEAGVLTALIPDFSNIFAHMQYDMYHVFTADEHTIYAVGMMHKIENGDLAEAAPLATDLFRKIQSRRALYVGMFLHDIAKGTGGAHSTKGAEIARRVCPQMGLSDEETETAAWLVEHHLLMTMTAFKRDLNDAKTIEDFVALVQSPERLKLLTILTTSDIMAVGPDRWNNWKAGLLSELYFKAIEHMAGTPRDREDSDQFIILQKKVRRLVGEETKALQYLGDYAPKYFWLSFPPEAIAGFVHALHKNTGKVDATVIRISPNPQQDFTEVFIFTPDRKGLFATLSGAMAASGASIADARIFTLTNGMALDIFQIQDLNGHVYENTSFLQKTLKAALAGTIDLAAEIAERQRTAPKKGQHFRVPPRVIIDNDASASNTVIEVNGRDRPGFLYDVTSALTNAGLQISAAKITTFGSRAVDVFYVKDSFGLKIVHRNKLQSIENALKAALEKTPEKAI
ncbi:MAG: [protein-PII] uridylyltransferase [Alphaproteobacteria bacterium]|nr:MAG: [protein-PII] uridylyltransferase [Alphaproteobacteria bacterium]